MYKTDFFYIIPILDFIVLLYSFTLIYTKTDQNKISHFLFWRIKTPKNILFILMSLYILMIVVFFINMFILSIVSDSYKNNEYLQIFLNPGMAIIYASLIIYLFIYDFKNLFLKIVKNILLFFSLLIILLNILIWIVAII